MSKITFAYPGYLYLLILLIPLIAWYIYRYQREQVTVTVSNTSRFGLSIKNYKYYIRHLPFVLRVMALALLIAVVARPQSVNRWKSTTTEGIDIMMALDISTSMLALDFSPDRLEAAKNVATEFISGRPNDRMGLVVFGSESFTQCPLTTDHAALVNLLRDVRSGMVEDGTAIGLGLANAVNRLKDSKAISKVIILLTDGMNNAGAIAPVTSAELAKSFGIHVYTIGVGTRGTALYPMPTQYGIRKVTMEVNIDEDVLRQIAKMTDGKYFRATDNQKLAEIYKEIDKLEKSRIEMHEYSKKEEEYLSFGMIALFLLISEWLLRNLILRSIP
jgi:Ca-activated chloride channel homolog